MEGTLSLESWVTCLRPYSSQWSWNLPGITAWLVESHVGSEEIEFQALGPH